MVSLAYIITSGVVGVTTVIGPTEREISRVVPMDGRLSETTLTFFHAKRAGEQIPAHVLSGAVLCTADALPLEPNPAVSYLIVENPRLAAIRVLQLFFSQPKEPGIHSSAVIEAGAQIGAGVQIGPFVYIGKDVTIGARCSIDAGAAIGGTGFGYERDETGALQLFPHSGRVIIEDDVDIGSNVTIDRATFTETRIGQGVKIDNLAYIAHNVTVGRDTMIMASSVICGSVRIGERCWIAPSVTIRDGVAIGNDVTVGIGSLVLADVADGSVVYGRPAQRRD